MVAYYSRDYELYGVICQACINSNLNFHTLELFHQDLQNAIHHIQWYQFYYSLADAAYTFSEYLLIPFTGADQLDLAQAFNFYLLKLRILVEMASERLVQKFQILSGKINVTLDQVTQILMEFA
jgi:hypothetical protein